MVLFGLVEDIEAPGTPQLAGQRFGRAQTVGEASESRLRGVDERSRRLEQRRRAQGALGASEEFRRRQVGLADVLTEGGPSAAELQLQAGQEAASRQALALARSGRGSPALAARQASRAQAGLAAQAGQQAGILRAQETARQQQLLAQVLGGGRAQDIQLGGAELAIGGQDLSAAALSQARELGLRGETTTRDIAQLQAEQQAAALAFQAQQARAQQQAAEVGFFADLAGSALPLLASDKRRKRNIGRGNRDARAFLNSLKPRMFRYDVDKDETPKRLGIMAQDLEKTRAGKGIVRQTPGGKAIDVTQATGAMLAALGDLHGRMGKIERGGK